MGSLFKVIAFVAIISCLLANMAVATRLLYSLSRDRLLPGHQVLSAVNSRTRTPVVAIVVVAVFGLVINLLSAGIITRVISIVTICYYLTYMLTLISVLVGHRAGRIPPAPGYFTIHENRLGPLVWTGIVYTLVAILALTLPAVNHISAEYSAGGLLIGVLWWALYLRPRLNDRSIGPREVIPAPLETVGAPSAAHPAAAETV